MFRKSNPVNYNLAGYFYINCTATEVNQNQLNTISQLPINKTTILY